MSRAEFHRQHLERARVEAQRLFEQRAVLQGAWLAWVASQLYVLKPAEYASMVRRELQRLQEQGAD
ncbi:MULTISPECIES: hypothetical protein [Pseudomonas]|uniref:Uncharacterized protein n=1 Tax=Pseudomonas chlororaphis TaxID=587753 RepID=A0AAX3G5N2_9PSED|nr:MULTISPECIES: hypothetical protein [Pseudomonas]AZC36938.1 hypothetical protein C4K37_2551 [Pseudomonas chlororaphis subsp. piscium]AZC43483.1 hypothetical protein C4K36_2558 [Pseudomonas chlororaphis subsp. piscium]AZC50177.1 hypothetical protein C4K35_2594 [Pseudomonas chlororaphis subsp. piscium]AZC56754.1 hypothetical protein C4K34_2589 [Pseudomonas chlororaphis subsp. piscium]AZC69209.1 hypothetical protein C4K32_2547 [Pseudomonas chlororaphis subsp. piscium]